MRDTKEVFLTSAGLEQAKLISNKHHIIRKFLIDVLKVDADVTDKDACSVEHVISSDSVRAMQEFMQANRTK